MKTYIPSNYINSNYKYTISNNYYVVHTNNNCYQNYNTTYCDCYNIYPSNDYIVSEVYSCNFNPSTYISSNNFTNDYWYRSDLSDILIIFVILFLFIFYFPFKIIQRFFGRWLKV